MFENFWGNRAVTESLEQMIGGQRLSQTLLFSGREGVGKATLARRMAARLLVDRRRPGGIDHTALRTDPLAANMVSTLRMLLSLPIDVAALVSDGLDVAGGMPGSWSKVLLARLPGSIPSAVDLGPDAIGIAAGIAIEERPRDVDDAVIDRTYPDRALQRLIAMRAICDRLPFSDLPQPGLGRVAAADLVQRIMILLQKVEGHDVVAGRMIQIRNAGDLLEVLRSEEHT